MLAMLAVFPPTLPRCFTSPKLHGGGGASPWDRGSPGTAVDDHLSEIQCARYTQLNALVYPQS